MLPLILHADDFGLNRAVSDGILRGFRQGLLTSTSLLANAPDVARAIVEWKKLQEECSVGGLPSAKVREKLGEPYCPFDLGVHLNLTQGRPLAGDRYPAELLDSEGRFPSVFKLFAKLWRSGEKFHAAIRAEFERQIQLLLDHGLQPTHLNGHQYVEMIPAAARLVPELMQRFNIKVVRVAWEPSLVKTTILNRFQIGKWPIAQVKHVFANRFRRMMDAKGIAHPDVFFGTAHAGGVDLNLLRLFLNCSRKSKFMEIGLHPGERDCPDFRLGENGTVPFSAFHRQDIADGWDDPLAASRPNEMQMLVSNDLPTLLQSVGRRLGRLVQITRSHVPG